MLQPKYPLEFSTVEGAYSSIREIQESVKQNVRFLLLTSPGEWPGNPDIGVGVRRFLFSNYPSQDLLDIHKTIREQFARYLPFVDVRSELVDKDQFGNKLIDSNQIKLIVRYNIQPLDVEDYLTIGVSETTSQSGL